MLNQPVSSETMWPNTGSLIYERLYLAPFSPALCRLPIKLPRYITTAHATLMNVHCGIAALHTPAPLLNESRQALGPITGYKQTHQ